MANLKLRCKGTNWLSYLWDAGMCAELNSNGVYALIGVRYDWCASFLTKALNDRLEMGEKVVLLKKNINVDYETSLTSNGGVGQWAAGTVQMLKPIVTRYLIRTSQTEKFDNYISSHDVSKNVDPLTLYVLDTISNRAQLK